MLHRLALVACLAVAAGCRSKPPDPAAPVAAKDEAPTFAAPPAADVAKVAAEVAPLGGTAAASKLEAVPAVVVEFPKGGPKEAEVPDLVRRLTATGVPVTVVVPANASLTEAAYGQILAMPNLRGFAAHGPAALAALAAAPEGCPLEHVSTGGQTVPDEALTKLRRLRVLSLSARAYPPAVLDRLADLPDLHHLRLAGGVDPDVVTRVCRLTGLRTLVLDGGNFGDADLAPLAAMVNLRTVQLFGERVTKEAYAHLVDLPELASPIVLPGATGYTDSSLGHFGRMRGADKIERWQIGGSAVTGAGLAHLRTLTGLKELGLYGVREADAAGLAVVAALPKLTRLSIGVGHEMLPETAPGRMPVIFQPGVPSAAAFEGLAGAAAIKELWVTNATDDHLVPVGKMATLEELKLDWQTTTWRDGTKRPPAGVLTDAGLAHLKGAPRLRFLDASGCLVTDAGMAHLAAFPALTELKLYAAAGATPLTDAGAEALARAKGLRVLSLSNTALTDAGVAALARLPELRHIHIGSDQITDAVVDEILRIPHLEGASVGGARLRTASERLRTERPNLFRYPPR